MVANINHLNYSITQFNDLLVQTGLKNDFDMAMSYMNQLKEQVYPGAPV